MNTAILIAAVMFGTLVFYDVIKKLIDKYLINKD